MPGLLQQITDALQRLASSADSQVSYLQSMNLSADELALELDDSLPALGSLLESGQVTDQQAAAMRRVDEALSQMSGRANRELWTEEGLRHAPEWERVRNLAGEALALLNSR
jgi:hypothetical protein